MLRTVRARIVGVDIDQRRSSFEESQIELRIGDQSDPGLASLVDEFAPLDVVIDDGSHMMSHICASFDALYPHTTGVYMVEDLHTAYWPAFGGSLSGDTFIKRAKR